MLHERDLEIADAWIRKHVVDTGDYDFDDVVEEGHTVKYWFHRCDRAAVVFLVTVTRGQLFSIKKEVYREETQSDRPDEEQWIVEGGQSRRRCRPFARVAAEALPVRPGWGAMAA